ncbi:hypothetical protein AcW1_005373 [Taiwanofungus camphoratus]|nr:hypothetical protein AcW1_005373 [Antrodia cinnamomea]
MAISYGKTTPTSYLDPEVQAINRCLGRLGSALRHGTYLVDTYPFLRYIPGYVSHLPNCREEELQLFREQAAREAQPSFTTYLLDNQETLGLSDNELAYLVGSMFGAGSDTTAPALDGGSSVLSRGAGQSAGATGQGSGPQQTTISRNPDVYPEPEDFRPQRWLDAGGRFRDDIRFFNFGFGRRICPGQHVADKYD